MNKKLRILFIGNSHTYMNDMPEMVAKYDYVVLQEHSHPFGPEEDFFQAASALNDWIREAGNIPVIYMTWARKEEESEQERMTRVHREVAESIDALLAPVGEYWWDYMRSWPEVNMYKRDGSHASSHGSDFAAKYIRDAIYRDLYSKNKKEG